MTASPPINPSRRGFYSVAWLAGFWGIVLTQGDWAILLPGRLSNLFLLDQHLLPFRNYWIAEGPTRFFATPLGIFGLVLILGGGVLLSYYWGRRSRPWILPLGNSCIILLCAVALHLFGYICTGKPALFEGP